MHLRLNWIYYILITVCFHSSVTAALQLDSKEKVFIVADTTTYNYKTGVKIFLGNVKVDQGTTHLTADKVITKDNERHQLEELLAFGVLQSAHYWTLPKIGDTELHSYAKTIKFHPLLANVTLEQDVVVIQGENSFKGQLIHYNMDDQTITVPASKNARAELVYTPEK
ncbi:MAG: lipopolysaccharide transport periplasmic protein LptA [Gammaproteobacteria bacterium]|nr:lipopolysaccharide transport periplasmic protein LptA [Gammaproteobacteria bacterium]